jgi:hypothetical protein
MYQAGVEEKEMNETNLLAAAFVGALGSGLIGWADAHEPFDVHKFMGTIWRALFAAMLWFSSQSFVDLSGSSAALLVWAALSGAGIDAVGNRIQGVAKGKEPSMAQRLKAIQDAVDKLKGP